MNFGFHSQNCTKLGITLIICTILSFFFCRCGVFVVDGFKFVTYVFKGRCHGNQTEFIIRKIGKNSSHMHFIFNIFVSAGGFKTMISDMLL